MIIRILQDPPEFLAEQIETWDPELKQWIYFQTTSECIGLTNAKVKKKDKLTWLAGTFFDQEYHEELIGEPINWEEEEKTYPVVYWVGDFEAYQ